MKNNNLKSNIINKITSTSAHQNNERTKIGHIKASDERSGVCTVEYRNEDGVIETNEKVYVMIQNPDIISWFPKVGDFVFLVNHNTVATITGNANHLFDQSMLKKMTNFEKNIYANTSESYGGYII